MPLHQTRTRFSHCSNRSLGSTWTSCAQSPNWFDQSSLCKKTCAKPLAFSKWQCQQLGNPKAPISHTLIQQPVLFTLKPKDPVEPEEAAAKSQASQTVLLPSIAAWSCWKNTSEPSLCTIATSKERSGSICHRHWNGTPKSTNIYEVSLQQSWYETVLLVRMMG